MNFKHSNATMPSNSQVQYIILAGVVPQLTHDYQVKVDRVGLRVHLCADSLAAITAFAGDLTTIFKPPGDDLYVIIDSYTTTYRFTCYQPIKTEAATYSCIEAIHNELQYHE